jgi:hypothetical protein
MKNKHIKPRVTAWLTILMPGLALAQTAVTAAGGEATGTGGSASYSVGQVAYSSNLNKNMRISAGVQQPYEIFSLSAVQPIAKASVRVYPNPAKEYLEIRTDLPGGSLQYKLFDQQGRLCQSGALRETQTHIDLHHLPAAMYFLHVVTLESTPVQTFKITKHTP